MVVSTLVVGTNYWINIIYIYLLLRILLFITTYLFYLKVFLLCFGRLMSFFRLMGVLPCELVYALGCYSNSLWVHLPLLLHTICSANLHFRWAITSTSSLTLVLDLIQVFFFQPRKEVLSIACSIALCETRSFYADFFGWGT